MNIEALDFAGVYANCFLFGILPPAMAYIFKSRGKLRSSLPGGDRVLFLLFSVAVMFTGFLKLSVLSLQTPHIVLELRNLDQLEALSKKLKAKTLRGEAPSQSIAATRHPSDTPMHKLLLWRELRICQHIRLTNEQRAAITAYFHVYKGNENSLKKVSLGGPALHPFLARSYTEYLKTFFEETFLCSQKLLSSEEIYEKVLDLMSTCDSNLNSLVINNILIVTNTGLLHFSLVVL